MHGRFQHPSPHLSSTSELSAAHPDTVRVFDIFSPPPSHTGNLLLDTCRLRYAIFCQRLTWPLNARNGIEFDAFDGPATLYLAVVDQYGRLLGMARLLPTCCAFSTCTMVEALWPHAVQGALPHGNHIYEGSRLAVAAELADCPELRRKVLDALVIGLFEFALKIGLTAIFSSMHPRVWDGVFISRGCEVERLGPDTNLGTIHSPEWIFVAQLHVTRAAYDRLREAAGIRRSVIEVLVDPGMYGAKDPLWSAEDLIRFETTIRGVCAHKLPPALVDDAVQVTYARAIYELEKGIVVDTPKAWLKRIARSVAATMFKRDKRHQHLPLDGLPEPVYLQTRSGEASEVDTRFARLDPHLRPNERELIRLLCTGLKRYEAAEKLGIAPQSVSRILNRIKTKASSL